MLCGVEEYRVFEPHRHLGNIAFYVFSMWTMFLCGKESDRRILCGPLRALRLKNCGLREFRVYNSTKLE